MTNIILNKYFFIINPNAGSEDIKKVWPKIATLISHDKINYDLDFTNYNGHAEEIVTEKIREGYRKFIVVGGDGTLNEVVNGIFKQKEVPTNDIYLGLFSMGTGNDWARYYKFSTDINETINRIKWGQTRTQDIGKIVYYVDNKPKEAYFINIAGLCFDSIVVKTTNKMKERGRRTKTGYLLALLTSLLTYRPWSLEIYINGQELNGKFLSISVGNGKYSGGGMVQTPHALINDGLLDVTIYPNMPKTKMIANVNKLYNEKIYNIKGVKNFRTNYFRIESSHNNTFAQIDGEIIEGTSYEISIIPNSINIIV